MVIAARKPARTPVKKPAKKAVKKGAKKKKAVAKAKPALVIVGGGPAFHPFQWGLRWRYDIKVKKPEVVARGRKTKRPEGRTPWVLVVDDAQLEGVARGLAPSLAKGDVVLRIGQGGLDALAPAREKGAAVGVLSPLGGASGRVAGEQVYLNYRAAFMFDGDPRARALARKLVAARYGVLVAARRVDRARIDAAVGLLVSGVAVLGRAAEALIASALDPAPSARDLRVGVGVALRSAANALRTPAARGGDALFAHDPALVAARLAALAEHAPARDLYRDVVRVALDSGLAPDDARDALAAALGATVPG